mgnify:CR=1 FL=1
MTPRVLLVSPVPPPIGGISRWTEKMIDVFANSTEIELCVFDTAPRRRRSLTLTTRQRIREGLWRGLSEISRFWWCVLHTRPAVVHLNTSGSLALARDCAMLTILRVMRIPAVLHIRYGRVPEVAQKRGWEWILTKLGARMATLIVTLDKETQRVLGSQGASTITIPNFVDTAIPSRPISERSRNFLFVGWVVTSKGILDLLEAWRLARPQGWRLDIVGPIGDEATIRESVSSEIPGVTFLGETDKEHVAEMMQDCGIFVLPSHTEGFPNVISEAMAAGAPIIATSVGAIPDMLDGMAGVVIAPHDPIQLGAAMSRLASDPGEREHLRRAARARCVAMYGVSTVVTQYREAWVVLARHGSRSEAQHSGLSVR